MSQNSVLLSARREVWLVVVVNILALTWTVGYCYLNGYQHEPTDWIVQEGFAQARTGSDLQQIGGLPDWVLVGIFFPWILCTAFTVGICMGIQDDDLGLDTEEPKHAGH